jgi:anti-sigma factor RsiW
MNCEAGKTMVTLYCSGELDGRAMAEFEQHVQRCSDCARELELVLSYDAILKDAFLTEQLRTDELRKSVIEKLRIPNSDAFRRRSIPAWAKVAAATVLILVAVFGVYLKLHRSSLPTTYTAAMEDHLDEIVLGQPRKSWRVTPDEIDAFLKAKLQDTVLVKKLCPPDYRLMRVKVCDLAGEPYVHMVYSNGDHSVSFFAKVVNTGERQFSLDPRIEGHSSGELRVDGFQTSRLKLLVVSDLPREENFRLARETALRIAEDRSWAAL